MEVAAGLLGPERLFSVHISDSDPWVTAEQRGADWRRHPEAT